jgi:hypothetical protein
MILTFTAKIWYWRGPSPYHFVTVPPEQSASLRAIMREVTYGWGMIPIRAKVGKTDWKTSMFPKDGGYIVPLKDKIRKAEALGEGDEIEIEIEVDV